MPDVCLYFQVHQPNRLLSYDFFKIGENAVYEDEAMNREILGKVADKCYLPANRMFRKLVEKNDGRFRMALSISGTVIEQMERYRPDVLESFKELVASGSVELLAETYYHSLSFVHSNKEFDRQVELHLQKLEEVFHVRPRVFRNTELIYNDAIAAKAETMGFDGIIAEGVERNLNGQSANFLYRAPTTARIKTLLRNIPLSDDLGFRFSDPNWPEHPLTPGKFAGWLAGCEGDVVNLFMDYESIGEHQWDETGIFEFWENLPDAVEEAGLQWVTPSEAVELYRASREYGSERITSWADAERDLSAWMGNVMQQEAIAKVHRLEQQILAVNDPDLTDTWAKMQTSDHFYWMSTKGGTDGSVHSYFTPYPSPYDAYIYFMNVLADLQIRLRRAQEQKALS
ncbi:glycoside hydrolase family 57 protein [Luteolibacter yonseiensis]|uniref:Glycoside hydrolase family 57 protein n=1 Tax=Luteolibacter yonseiensis TaxID=1144680 RepID=A0A934R3C5_9BACT|nr:glycoside hydrolase family 57 protein [Luteolibacter yonseiensis]MBK1816281.1 glycoside hydrolase family 57 protein [Luteolibacter yonseiensis]